MPDTLSLSTGVSLGLLAGIVSGVCYLVANGLSWPRDEESPRNVKKSLTSFQKPRVCVQCGGQTDGGVVPCICHHHKPVKFESGAWFLRQVQRAISLMPWSISTDKLEQIEEECEPSSGTSEESNGDLHSIREFLELLSAKLAGGPLEGTRVAPIYDHPAYLPPAHSVAGAGGLASGGASGAHAQLKRLVARVVEEAAALPALARYAAAPSPAPTIESSTYEDLLATAILNKVIERYQTESGSGGRSSGIHSASASPSPSDRSSPRSLNSRNTREVSPQLRDEDDVSDWEEGEAIEDAVELPRRVPFPEFGGDIVHQDNEDRDFDDISSSDIQAVDGSWEENWLFQKKKIKTIQSVPVPMLVPNSNTEYRALIGDRDAEDTTDLSDNASDSEEQTSEFKSNIKNVLDSKHVIGGKAKVDEVIDDFEPDSLMILDEHVQIDQSYNERKENGNNFKVSDINKENNEEISINNVDDNEDRKDSILVLDVESGPPPKAEFNLNEEIHRSIFNGIQVGQLIDLNTSETMAEDSLDGIDNVTNSGGCGDGTTNTLSRHERVGEYEETVTVPVQRYADSLRRQHYDTEDKECPLVENDNGEDLIPGTIAYRERKKWLNYVEMPNNPYSPEAIQKRLSAKSASSLFDSLTSKSKDFEVANREPPSHDAVKEEEVEIVEKKLNGSINGDINDKMYLLEMNINELDTESYKDEIKSPKTIKHTLSEEIPQYKRYGRDYYIKEAKMSSGARKASSLSGSCCVSPMRKSTSLDNIDTEFASPGLLIKQFTTIATNQHYTKFAGKDEMQISVTTTPNNKHEILIEYEDANEHTLFAAKPALADDRTDEKFEEILHSAYNANTAPLTIEIVNYSVGTEKPSNNLSTETSFLSSSSLEDSIKIYNVQTGEIVKCKPEDKVSPRYDEAADDNDIEVADKALADTNDRFTPNGDVVEDMVKTNDNATEDSFCKISEIEDILPQLPKVKELAKKFVSMENLNEPTKPSREYLKRRKSKDNMLNNEDRTEKPFNKLIYMHSLTARSISKEFREELKLSMATPLTVPGGAKEFPEGIEEVLKESSRPGSPVPEPGTIKTKLAFFESLKSKFSNK